MYMNKQTSEMLKILLNSPGQYFTCEALAEYLHVSTRTIRNYMTTIRDFMNQNGIMKNARKIRCFLASLIIQ